MAPWLRQTFLTMVLCISVGLSAQEQDSEPNEDQDAITAEEEGPQSDEPSTSAEENLEASSETEPTVSADPAPTPESASTSEATPPSEPTPAPSVAKPPPPAQRQATPKPAAKITPPGQAIPSVRAGGGERFAKQLFFPVDRNGVKILPQRFEYQLIDNETFRIGDALFSARDFHFNLREDVSNKNFFALSLRWPSAILQVGEVHLKDSAGKSLWSQTIDPKQTRINKAKNTEGTRNWTSSTEVTRIPRETLERLQYYPYFQICVQRQDRETRIMLCSRDLYVTGGNENLVIADRSGMRDKSFVEINGRSVDPQGAIFLKDNADRIYLRSLFLSGASIEIQTSLKEVEFLDLYSTRRPGMYVLRGMGAVPVDGVTFRRISSAIWEAPLNAQRPSIFLKGEGGIPLKQEFLIEGRVRAPRLRVGVTQVASLSGSGPTSGIAGSENWDALLKPNVQSRIEGLEQGSRVEYEKQNVIWKVSGIETEKKNRRYVKITAGDETLVGAFDFERKRTSQLFGRLTYPLGASAGYVTNPIHSRWSYLAGADMQLGRAKSTDPLLNRFKLGATFHARDLSPDYRPLPVEIGLAASYVSTDEKFPMLSGLLNAAMSTPRFMRILGNWTQLQVEMPFAGGKSPFKIKPSFMVDLNFIRGSTTGWTYGIFAHQYAFASDTASSTVSRTGLHFGYFYNF